MGREFPEGGLWSGSTAKLQAQIDQLFGVLDQVRAGALA